MDTIGNSVCYILAMFGNTSDTFKQYTLAYYLNRKVGSILVVSLIASLGLPMKLYEKIKNRKGAELVTNVLLLLVLFASMSSIVNGNYSPFIYFRF